MMGGTLQGAAVGNWTTRGYANSRTGHLADWSTTELSKLFQILTMSAEKYALIKHNEKNERVCNYWYCLWC